jgi:aspartyl/glutamyl-tRNA(Asn/Gln) amidotransferase C subunit
MMPDMNKDDILRLGTLARIKISDEEAEALKGDITAVLEYVSVVNDIAASSDLTKEVGVVYNVFREDVVTVAPGTHTEDLLAEAPARKGQYVSVKKILNTD